MYKLLSDKNIRHRGLLLHYRSKPVQSAPTFHGNVYRITEIKNGKFQYNTRTAFYCICEFFRL